MAVACLILASTTYVIGQMTGAGVAFSRFLEVSNTAGLLIAAVVVLFYAVLGGMKALPTRKYFNTIVLIALLCILLYSFRFNLTGNPIPPLGLFGTDTASGTPLLQSWIC